MSFEALSLAASAGTFLVIAATAIAAIVQLRHMRSSSQITALSKLEDMWDDPALVNARRRLLQELDGRLRDSQFRAELKADTSSDELVLCMNAICNFYETMGVYVKHGLADGDVVCDFWSVNVIGAWRSLTPAIAIVRSGSTGDRVWENFEYMVTVAQRFIDKHPNGTFPRGTPRLPLETADKPQI
jgi:hypothetical protein